MEWNDSKASTLIKLRRSGIDVPKVYIISKNDFNQFLKFNKLKDGFSEQDILSGEFPEQLVDKLKSIINQTGFPAACRTSATNEDGLSYSFAGQFRSLMGISSLAEAIVALKYCWAGTKSLRVGNYYKMARIQEEEHKLPDVFFQPMISSRRSGIMFYSKKDDRATIESNWGMGESLASGISDADRAIINLSEPKKYMEKKGKNKSFVIYVRDTSKLVLGQHLTLSIEDEIFCVKFLGRGPLDHTIRVSVVFDGHYRSSIEDNLVSRLLSLASFIYEIFGIGLDIEWCEDFSGKIHIVQVRPISTKQKIGQEFFDFDNDDETVLSSGDTSGLLINKEDARNHQGAIILAGKEFIPLDTPNILRANGVITATGGMLSHVAIVCREVGIPCVHLTSEWSDLPIGSNVRLNTSAKVKVRKLEQNDKNLAKDKSDKTSSVYRFLNTRILRYAFYDIFHDEFTERLEL